MRPAAALLLLGSRLACVYAAACSNMTLTALKSAGACMPWQGGQQGELRYEFAQPLPPLPAPGEVERPVTAVDAGALSFPADMSVRTLRCGPAREMALLATMAVT